MLDAVFGQQLRQEFRFFNRGRAHKDRLACFVRLFDFSCNRSEFFLRGTIHLVVFIDALNGAVGRHFDNAQTINFGEFFGLGHGRAGHTAKLVIQTEIVLERHTGECHVFRLNGTILFRFDRLVQTIRQAATMHHPARKFVDQHNVAIANDIVFVPLEHFMGPQTLVHMVHQSCAFGIIQRLPLWHHVHLLQTTFDEFVAIISQADLLGFFIKREMLFGQFGDQGINRLVQIRTILRGTGNDQRRTRFVNQDRVNLVHDREVMVALEHLGQFRFHVVAKVIETQFVVGRIGHITGISGLFFLIRLLGHNDTGGHAQNAENLAHPFGVATGEIVVHRHNMHTAPCEGVQICGEGRNKSFTLAGFHFRNIALMQENATHQLHIECPQTQGAFCAFAAVGKGFGQNCVQRFAIGNPLAEFGGLFFQTLVAQLFKLGLQRVDFCNDRPRCFYFAVVRGAKDLFGQRSQSKHVLSAPHQGP